MTVIDRYNRINIHHHLRDDVVVLLPHVSYRNGTTGFGNGRVMPRTQSSAIGGEALRMLDDCARADTTELEEKRAVAMEQLRQGFDLTFQQQFPSFDIPNNWGRIYEQYPALLSHPFVAARYFSTAEISDAGSDSLQLEQLIARRRDCGIYTVGDSMSIDRNLGPAVVGKHVSERLESWRPRQSFLARWTA